jgi:hypothetical protein
LVYAYRALFVMKLMDDFALPDPNQDRAKLKFGLSLISFTVNGVCSTDLKDQFCMIKIQQTPADLTCAGMGTFLKNVGCCAPSVFDLYQGLCNVDQAVKLAQGGVSNCQTQLNAVRTQIDSCAGLSLGLSCAKVKYLLVHNALVTGIAPAWLALAANKIRLIIELKKVIAFAIGVDIALITELKIAAASNGRRLLQTGAIEVTTTITPPSFGATKSANELIGELDPLGVNDAIQTTTPGGSLGQPTVVGLSTTNIAATNDASAVSPVFALLAGVGIFLF